MANKIDIPNGWEVKKLGEIGNFLKGKDIKMIFYLLALVKQKKKLVNQLHI